MTGWEGGRAACPVLRPKAAERPVGPMPFANAAARLPAPALSTNRLPPTQRLPTHAPHPAPSLRSDHFSYGDISGLGRAASQGGLLRHQFYNRGHGVWAEERQRQRLPSLVDTGQHAGRSRVNYRGANLAWHLLRRDFFITVLEVRLQAARAGVGQPGGRRRRAACPAPGRPTQQPARVPAAASHI